MRFRRARPELTIQPVLPDLLGPDLDLVFCGTAPGHVSARAQAYYAHKQNKFWPTLHAVGLTPRLFAPHDYPMLLALGIGLTDLCKHASGMDHQLPKDAFDVDGLRARIECYAPRVLAFTSLNGGRAVCGRKAVYGPQERRFGDTELWIVPSPSPAAMNAWTIAPWKALAERVRALALSPRRKPGPMSQRADS